MLNNRLPQSCCYLQWSKFIFWIFVLALALFPKVGTASEVSWRKSLTKGTSDLNNQALAMAEACFRRAVKDLEIVPHTAEDKAKCLNSLAEALALENKTKEAETVYRQSLDILAQAYGKDNPRVLDLLFTLGSIYESEGDHQSAMHYYSRAIAINERRFGPYTPAFADLLPRLVQDENGEQISEMNHDRKTQLSTLTQQPGLNASKELLSILGNYNKDFFRKEDSSGQDLIADFCKQILNTGADSLGSNKISIPSSSLKNPVFPSRGF